MILTHRDEEILKGLSMGPSNPSSIQKAYFKNENYISSLPAVSRRLSKLVKNGYLLKFIENGKTLFCLSEAGISFLKDKFGINVDLNIMKKKWKRDYSVFKRKNPNNKNVKITPRDISILEYLSCGPCTHALLKRFFRKPDGSPLSKPIAIERLQKLSEFGYLKKIYYRDKPGILYFIGDEGAQYLIDNLNYDIERIRMGVVKGREIAHELLVSDIVRSIKKEENKALYEVSTLYDDNYLRYLSGGRRGAIVPDLLLVIKLPDGRKFTYNIEVDISKRPARMLVEKIKNYQFNILIITSTIKRRMALHKEILKTNNINLISRTFLALHTDVMKEGLVSCRHWKGADRAPAEII